VVKHPVLLRLARTVRRARRARAGTCPSPSPACNPSASDFPPAQRPPSC